MISQKTFLRHPNYSGRYGPYEHDNRNVEVLPILLPWQPRLPLRGDLQPASPNLKPSLLNDPAPHLSLPS
jgi:hypothetical protein